MTTTARATLWSITINNPTPEDDEAIALARQKGWQVLGQKEQGEKDGTLHYQIALKTPQLRFSAVKKHFPRAHIEVAKQPVALLNYVVKEATRVGGLQEQQNKYPSLSTFWDLVFDYLNGIGKDGLDYVELADGNVRMFKTDRHKVWTSKPLSILDEATSDLIVKGFHVEGIAGNPSIRSQWNLFRDAIMLRCYAKKYNEALDVQHAEVPIYEGSQIREAGPEGTPTEHSHHEDSPEDDS